VATAAQEAIQRTIQLATSMSFVAVIVGTSATPSSKAILGYFFSEACGLLCATAGCALRGAEGSGGDVMSTVVGKYRLESHALVACQIGDDLTHPRTTHHSIVWAGPAADTMEATARDVVGQNEPAKRTRKHGY
jgi:hypothetical protein